jgi:hypothetical protein
MASLEFVLGDRRKSYQFSRDRKSGDESPRWQAAA